MMRSCRKVRVTRTVLWSFAVVAAVVVISWLHGQLGSEREGTGGAGSPGAKRNGGSGVAAPAAGDLDEDIVADALDDATDNVTGDGRVVAGKTVAQWKVEKVMTGIAVEEALSQVRRKRQDAYSALPPYHTVEKDLKLRLREQLREISADSIDSLVQTATELEEAFWREGDFDNAASFDAIYRARAMLELCLEVAPTHEAALRQLCEVIQAGWPRFDSDESDPRLRWCSYQRDMDLFAPLWTLWQEHISKKTSVSAEDMYYAFDLIASTGVNDLDRARYAAEFEAQNPNPSDQMRRLFSNGVPTEKRLEVARWAVQKANQQGGGYSWYAEYFQDVIDRTEAGKPLSSRLFLWDENQYQNHGELYRLFLGRGWSFVGPESRRARLVPFHLIREGRPPAKSLSE